MFDICHRHFDTLDSTNSQLMLDITKGVLNDDNVHLYTANHQTAGRGQHGRTWISGDGNVFLSLYAPLGADIHSLHHLSGLLSLVVGLSLTKLPAILQINIKRNHNQLPPIGVKWTNDIGFYDNISHLFHKLAGILIEPVYKKPASSTLVGVIIGVGLNVNYAPVIQDGLYRATCLTHLDDSLQLTAADLYLPICNLILHAVQTCNNCSQQDKLLSFIDEFNHHHILQNKNIAIFMQNNIRDIYAQGKCIGIGHDGELLLQNDNTLIPIYAGMAQII